MTNEKLLEILKRDAIAIFSEEGLKEKLEARGIGVTVLGDGARPSNIMEGLRTAYEAISGK